MALFGSSGGGPVGSGWGMSGRAVERRLAVEVGQGMVLVASWGVLVGVFGSGQVTSFSSEAGKIVKKKRNRDVKRSTLPGKKKCQHFYLGKNERIIFIRMKSPILSKS